MPAAEWWSVLPSLRRYALDCRDTFLGWSPEARERNCHLLSYNSRYPNKNKIQTFLQWICLFKINRKTGREGTFFP
jgi:hypothetical protein